MNKRPNIYLDYAATTPVDQRVVEKILPYFSETFGNPSSIHSHGQKAENALESAREMVAEILNCLPEEIIFTSCGTESDNLALRGIAFAERETRGANRILISPVEHHAVSHTVRDLQQNFGFHIDFLPVNQYGQVSPDAVETSLRPETAIVSIIYANNEIGTINPLPEIGKICATNGIPLHTDAVQAATYMPLDVKGLSIDSMSIGAHKFYGPKGVGALYIRKGLRVHAVQTGGGQENGRRAGTQNIPYIVGMAEALRLVTREKETLVERVLPLRDRLIGTILEEISDAELTGHPSQRLPNHASFVFRGVDGNKLLMALDMAGFSCSSGSACKTGNPEPSEVLTAIGYNREWALGSLRITLGKGNLPSDIEYLLVELPKIIRNIRRL